jgi:hypothetical protein
MQRALDSEALCEHPTPDSRREGEDLFFDGCVDAPLGMHESLSGKAWEISTAKTNMSDWFRISSTTQESGTASVGVGPCNHVQEV